MSTGRPNKFTPENCDKIIYAISRGAPYSIACGYAGISYESLRQWKIAAKSGNPQYADFLVRLNRAEGETAIKWLEVIDNAMVKEWTAAAWKLERRHYKFFSSNPVVRQEIKLLEQKLNRIEKRQLEGENDGNKNAKGSEEKLDKESSEQK